MTSKSDRPWPFIRWSPHPSVPEVDVELLSVPAEPAPKTERCWLCLGSGEMLDCCSEPIACDACNSSGENGGGS